MEMPATVSTASPQCCRSCSVARRGSASRMAAPSSTLATEPTGRRLKLWFRSSRASSSARQIDTRQRILRRIARQRQDLARQRVHHRHRRARLALARLDASSSARPAAAAGRVPARSARFRAARDRASSRRRNCSACAGSCSPSRESSDAMTSLANGSDDSSGQRLHRPLMPHGAEMTSAEIPPSLHSNA